jgi:hypothetical protein
MIPVAKFNETILKCVLISSVSDREQDEKGSEKENLHRIQTGGNTIERGKQANHDEESSRS